MAANTLRGSYGGLLLKLLACLAGELEMIGKR